MNIPSPQDFQLEITKNYPVKSISKIRRQFFTYHLEKNGDKRIAARPNALVLNPPTIVKVEDEFSIDIWIAVYCKGFYVQVERNINHMDGPHAAKLFIQVYPGKSGVTGKFIHLGSAQFMFNFFDRKTLVKRLRKALRHREYFISADSEDILIEFDEPVRKIILA